VKVFVTGATGVLGRRVVPLLIAAGHEVTAVARSDGKAERLRTIGATPIRIDLFDADAVRGALAGHEAAINLATHIPSPREAAKRSGWDENDRIRREVSANLASAAGPAGVPVLIQESIALTYPDRKSEWIDESTPINPTPTLECVRVAEQNALSVDGSPVVLRFGLFYAPDSDFTQAQLRMTKRGLSPMLGSPSGYIATVDPDDAAVAVVLALDAPSGIYNVVDDNPVQRREYAAILAETAGRRRLWHTMGRIAKLAGDKRTGGSARSQRVSNRKFKDTTGWAPRHATVRSGLTAVAREILDSERAGDRR
jgi:nucleoside-diphosphate-sugar epimerase